MRPKQLPVAPVDAAWHKLLTNKYYVDEFYDAAIVRPLRATARFLHRVVDVGIVDGIVRRVAWLFGATGNEVRRVQNGDIQTYVTALVVGLAVILFLVGV